MAVIVPTGLPAAEILRAEGVHVIEDAPARGDDRLRPLNRLRVLLINLMPTKVATETQFARLLAAAPYDVELTLAVPDGYRTRSTAVDHMQSFYQPFSEVEGQSFDGVFMHRVTTRDGNTMAGFGDTFPMPVSRHTDVAADALPQDRGLRILAASEATGLGLVEDRPRAALYMFNHLEYDATSLVDEYWRDRANGDATEPPANTFPLDDTSATPINTWRPAGRRLFTNWLRAIAEDKLLADLDRIDFDFSHAA